MVPFSPNFLRFPFHFSPPSPFYQFSSLSPLSLLFSLFACCCLHLCAGHAAGVRAPAGHGPRDAAQSPAPNCCGVRRARGGTPHQACGEGAAGGDTPPPRRLACTRTACSRRCSGWRRDRGAVGGEGDQLTANRGRACPRRVVSGMISAEHFRALSTPRVIGGSMALRAYFARSVETGGAPVGPGQAPVVPGQTSDIPKCNCSSRMLVRSPDFLPGTMQSGAMVCLFSHT